MKSGALNKQDFERLFDQHAQPLFGFLVYRTADRGLAEDILADTFERAMRSRRRFDLRRGSEKNWLYAIALNLLRDHQRRAAAETRAIARAAEPLDGQGAGQGVLDGALESIADRELIHRALARLDPDERDAIALRYGGDLTVPEIAKLTGQPLTTVEGRVYRGLRKLREHLARPDAPLQTDSPPGAPARLSSPTV